MSKKQGLTWSQEERRIEGLRILARIIARHYLAHPELYPDPQASDGTSPSVNGRDVSDGKAAGRDDEHGP